MTQSGRFKTTTKTRIRTKYGTILKETTYDVDPESYPDIEYKIRPVCYCCGNPIDCLCFNSDNCDDLYEDALFNLKRQWICGSVMCLIQYQKEIDFKHYDVLYGNYKGNLYKISEDIADGLDTIESGESCGWNKIRW